MVTLTSAQNALKTVYLGVVADQLNISANPLLAKIKQTSRDVWGKEIRKLAPYGVNGGVSAGTESGQLPATGANNYVQFVSTLKNLYGQIEISDKAIRASANNAGAFVNLLNDEMESLIKASSFNLSRMLYGDGSGTVAKVTGVQATPKALVVDSIKNLMEGMIVDVWGTSSLVEGSLRISAIDREAKKIFFVKAFENNIQANNTIVVQGSRNQEITGLGSIFGSSTTLYGVDRASNSWINPVNKTAFGEISDIKLQTVVDGLEELSGGKVNFITTSAAVKRAYQQYLGFYRHNVEVMELVGGYKALSFNGIPLISDRFVADDTMYLLNTDDFVMHQLCDWQWLEGDDGKIIRQNGNYPTYTATLVKYADLVCDRPGGQAKISGILSTVTNPLV